MARPKGSKNKKKEPVAQIETPKEAWKPTPDMGHIQPPSPKVAVCKTCPHQRVMHYGGAAEWCNEKGCNCQAWSA